MSDKNSERREETTQILFDSGIEYERKNEGRHLIIKSKDDTIDFWPGTGKFIPRSTGKPYKGVHELIKLCKGSSTI